MISSMAAFTYISAAWTKLSCKGSENLCSRAQAEINILVGFALPQSNPDQSSCSPGSGCLPDLTLSDQFCSSSHHLQGMCNETSAGNVDPVKFHRLR